MLSMPDSASKELGLLGGETTIGGFQSVSSISIALPNNEPHTNALSCRGRKDILDTHQATHGRRFSFVLIIKDRIILLYALMDTGI